LQDLKADPWMQGQARSHAARIGKQELLDFRRYSMQPQHRPPASATSSPASPPPQQPTAAAALGAPPQVVACGGAGGATAGQGPASFTCRLRNYFKKRIG
jgi:hypothetical protein